MYLGTLTSGPSDGCLSVTDDSLGVNVVLVGLE